MSVAIIGGGAAGLFAACLLKKYGVSFTLFEREARVGKKLLATGNGRCNLSNMELDISRYHGQTDFAEFALLEFNQYSLMDFLREIGILCTTEGDKIFPRSLQASSVLDLLRLYAGEVSVETEVLSIKKEKNKYALHTTKGQMVFDNVLVCPGGKASRKLSGGGSYNLLTDMGYSLTKLTPSIVQLKCDGTKALEGIKTDAQVTVGDRKEFGEVLFTSYGLSGPPVLQVSRDAKGKQLKLDMANDLSFKELTDILTERKQLKHLTLENLFTGILNKKIGQYVLKRAEIIPLSRGVETLTNHEIKAIASVVKGLVFEITDTNGFDNAQVTAGGIDVKDFNSETMESKLHKGLYAAGEILNIDGDCGGFNLQWAFSSAYVAVRSIAGGAK